MRQIDAAQLGKVSFKPDTGDGGLVRKSYRLKLLTPLLGGDTESWVPNLERPIRVPAIKGQLRFWWRTMQDSADYKSLLKLEGEVWGANEKAAPVSLGIAYDSKPDIRTINKSDRGMLECPEYPKYVLFPLQGQEEPSFDIVHACAFTLNVSCKSDVWKEVETTLKLWVLFGGVGGRTRRGAGSLVCPELTVNLETPQKIAAFLRSCCQGQNLAFGTSRWPRLAGSRLAIAQAGKGDSCAVWKHFLDEYGSFRQGPGVGRGRGQGNRPGRSYWPEPDAFRRITKQSATNHDPEHPSGNWFPRAAYGMPVQTEFRNAGGDPGGKYFLQPEGKERWPSPMMLKVVRTMEEGPLFKCALVLNAAIPSALEVKVGKNTLHVLEKTEMPMAIEGKTMPKMQAFNEDCNPYSALIRHLHLEEMN